MRLPLEPCTGGLLLWDAMKSTTPTNIADAPPPVALPPSPYNFIGSVQSNPVRLMTLVAARIVVGAAHYQRENPLPSGCTIRFSPNPSKTITAQLSSIGVWDDIELFQLDRDVGIAPIGCATPDLLIAKNTFLATGLQNVLQEATPIIAPAVFQYVSGNQVKFKQSPSATIENGDSGAPDLVKFADGSLGLVGPHYSNQGPNTFWLTSIMSKYPDVMRAIS